MAKLFPKISPYRKGYLKVSDGHRLYYELCGNPKGKPVLFVHGGPGGGCSKDDRRFFNPKKFNVILFDQRGAGRSKPLGSLKGNTTRKLVQDMRKLLLFLKIDKVFLFGGSWGSTLSLVYAINYPETVSGMLLRGIFLASLKDVDYFINGPVKEIFPEARERFLSLVPEKERKGAVRYYSGKMNSAKRKTREKYKFEYAYYESTISHLKITHRQVMKKLKKWNYGAAALIEAKYVANDCFLEKNYILKNAHKISGIPAVIIHGRYDLVCPPLGAYKLHKKLKNSRLYFVLAGHSSSEKEIQSKLVSEMNKVKES